MHSVDQLRRLGEKNKRTVLESRERLAAAIRGHVPEDAFQTAMAAFDRAIDALRGTPAQREAMVSTLEAIGTEVREGMPGEFQRLNKPTIRPRRR